MIEKQAHAKDLNSFQKKIVYQNSPDLVKGINMVKSKNKEYVFQDLIIRKASNSTKQVLWIDSTNKASTYALKSEELMQRVYISRAFTAFQHFKAVKQALKHINEDTELLIIPEFTYLYLNSGMSEEETENLFTESWNLVKKTVEEHGLKVLVSKTSNTYIDSILEIEADKTIKVQKTNTGDRFYTDKFDTLYYPDSNGFQTTIPFWKIREKHAQNFVKIRNQG